MKEKIFKFIFTPVYQGEKILLNIFSLTHLVHRTCNMVFTIILMSFIEIYTSFESNTPDWT